MSAPWALVLAGGRGARFGGGKLLAPWRGGALLDGALAVALAAPVQEVVLVTGAEAEAVSAAARRLAGRQGQGDRLRIAYAPDHAQGLSASLRAGLAALPRDAEGVLVFLGDMPLVPPAVCAALVQELAQGAPAAAPVCRGQRGHPAAISRSLFAEVEGISGDRGARGVLDRLGDALVLVPTDDSGVLLDVDRPADVPP